MTYHPLPRRPASPLCLAPTRPPKRPRLQEKQPGSSHALPRKPVTPSSAPGSASSALSSDYLLTPTSASRSPTATSTGRASLDGSDELGKKADEVIARVTGISELLDRKAEDVIARLERQAKHSIEQEPTRSTYPMLRPQPSSAMPGPIYVRPALMPNSGPPFSAPACWTMQTLPSAGHVVSRPATTPIPSFGQAASDKPVRSRKHKFGSSDPS